MLVLASIFGILSAFGGYYLAAAINGSIAGAMATVAGILFGIVWVAILMQKRRPSKTAINYLD